nr:translation initiation factor IF-2-like [Chlorocebus sabaeus]
MPDSKKHFSRNRPGEAAFGDGTPRVKGEAARVQLPRAAHGAGIGLSAGESLSGRSARCQSPEPGRVPAPHTRPAAPGLFSATPSPVLGACTAAPRRPGLRGGGSRRGLSPSKERGRGERPGAGAAGRAGFGAPARGDGDARPRPPPLPWPIEAVGRRPESLAGSLGE